MKNGFTNLTNSENSIWEEPAKYSWRQGNAVYLVGSERVLYYETRRSQGTSTKHSCVLKFTLLKTRFD